MKTNPLLKPLFIEPPYSVAEEVLFTLSDSASEERVFLATALYLAAQAVIGRLAFEITTLNREQLCHFDSDSNTVTADPVITTAIKHMVFFVRIHLQAVQESVLTIDNEIASESAGNSMAEPPAAEPAVGTEDRNPHSG